LYNRGKTTDKFLIFINELLKSLQSTGRRVIMMDNLNTHTGEVENLIKMSGHMLVFRPTYSPDFAPIEWCFKYIDDFLQHHYLMINENNFASAIQAGLDSITPQNVISYMANAHMAVSNYPYTPYMGQQ
jgi:hypothetical protein